MYSDEKRDYEKFGEPDYNHFCYICGNRILTFGVMVDKNGKAWHPQCLEKLEKKRKKK